MSLWIAIFHLLIYSSFISLYLTLFLSFITFINSLIYHAYQFTHVYQTIHLLTFIHSCIKLIHHTHLSIYYANSRCNYSFIIVINNFHSFIRFIHHTFPFTYYAYLIHLFAYFIHLFITFIKPSIMVNSIYHLFIYLSGGKIKHYLATFSRKCLCLFNDYYF